MSLLFSIYVAEQEELLSSVPLEAFPNATFISHPRDRRRGSLKLRGHDTLVIK